MKKTNDRARQRLDERLASAKPTDRLRPPPRGWIRAIRDGLGMSGAQLGRRMSVTPQTIDALERSEAAGTIQLQNMQKAAEALGCQLVYAIVPDTSLEEMVRDRARSIAIKALRRVSQTMKLEDQDTTSSDLEARIADYVRDHISDRDLWTDLD